MNNKIKAYVNGTSVYINGFDFSASQMLEGTDAWHLYKDMLRFFSSIGFYVTKNKILAKKIPGQKDCFKYGRYSDLEFEADGYKNDIKITFFYMDRHSQMPYLVQKQFDLTINKLAKFLKERGIVLEREAVLRGESFVVQRYINSWHHPQNEAFCLSEVDGETAGFQYYAMDRDGKIIRNGEIKYFRDENGYLSQGKVYYDINNMWMVILPCGTVRKRSCSQLFDLADTDEKCRKAQERIPREYQLRKEQLRLCTTKELINELKRRKAEKTR